MGIFTNTLNEAYGENVYYNAEADLYDGDFTQEQAIGMDESFDLNFAEQGLYAVAEINQFYNNTMKQIGIAELAYFEANGKEMVYEAVDLSSLGEKIKNIFKKIIEKIKHLFHMFIARLGKMFSDNKSFVNKYRNEFIKKWSEVGSSATIKGFKFTIDDNSITSAKEFAVEELIGNVTNMIKSNGKLKSYDSETDLEKKNTKVSNNKDSIREAIRSDVATSLKTYFTKDVSVSSEMSDKEFSEWVYESCRNGESTKENLEIKTSFDTTEILNTVSDFSKVKSAITRISTRLTSASNKASREFEKDIKELTNATKTAEKDAAKDLTNKVGQTSLVASFTQSAFDDQIKAASIIATAFKDRTAQYKSIMVKVIGGGKSVTKEGYEFDDDNDNTSVNEGTSILDRVAIF